jgi:hypothetical protein
MVRRAQTVLFEKFESFSLWLHEADGDREPAVRQAASKLTAMNCSGAQIQAPNLLASVILAGA